MVVEHGSDFVETIDALTNLAYHFGPFFFAVIFSLVITRSAMRWYKSAPAKSEEKHTYQQYFRVTYVFAMVLVLLSVAWFMYAQYGKRHALEGVIMNLREHEFVDVKSEEFMIRERKRSTAQLRDLYFVIIRNQPLHKGDRIYVNYWEELKQTSGVGHPPAAKLIPVKIAYPDCFPQRFSIRREVGEVLFEPMQC